MPTPSTESNLPPSERTTERFILERLTEIRDILDRAFPAAPQAADEAVFAGGTSGPPVRHNGSGGGYGK